MEVAQFKNIDLSKSINALCINMDNKDLVTDSLLMIMSKYLALNVKGKSLTESGSIELVIEHIFDECGFLKIDEIDFIFKSGIKGKFGQIFNDISIDTICGVGGWIEKYKNDFRSLVPDAKTTQQLYRLSGKEMSREQFEAQNPEYKNKSALLELRYKAEKKQIKIADAREFYKIKELSLNDFKDDCEAYSSFYHRLSDEEKTCVSETNYLEYKFSEFILENIYKTKE